MRETVSESQRRYAEIEKPEFQIKCDYSDIGPTPSLLIIMANKVQVVM